MTVYTANYIFSPTKFSEAWTFHTLLETCKSFKHVVQYNHSVLHWSQGGFRDTSLHILYSWYFPTEMTVFDFNELNMIFLYFVKVNKLRCSVSFEILSPWYLHHIRKKQLATSRIIISFLAKSVRIVCNQDRMTVFMSMYSEQFSK